MVPEDRLVDDIERQTTAFYSCHSLPLWLRSNRLLVSEPQNDENDWVRVTRLMNTKTLATIFLFFVTGCLVVPVPESNPPILAGNKVTEQSMPFREGVTTKSDVVQRLGKPNFEMSDLRLIGYLWDEKDYHILLVLGSPNGGGVVELPSANYYVFFATFDAQDRLVAYGVEPSRKGFFGHTTIQDTARQWAKSRGTESTGQRQYVATDPVPPGQSLLYIYRSGGLQLVVPPDVNIDGALRGELKRDQYLSVLEVPGQHTITVIPMTVPPNSGVSLSLNLVADTKYFLSIRLPYTGLGPPAELAVRTEQEGMPILLDMSPTR